MDEVPKKRRKRVRVYIPGEWSRRARVDPRSKSRKLGRPRQKFVAVDDPAERARLNCRWWSNSAAPVLRGWRFEAHTRSKAEILGEAAVHSYAEWFESLDDELPPGVELTHVLWGYPS